MNARGSSLVSTARANKGRHRKQEETSELRIGARLREATHRPRTVATLRRSVGTTCSRAPARYGRRVSSQACERGCLLTRTTWSATSSRTRLRRPVRASSERASERTNKQTNKSQRNKSATKESCGSLRGARAGAREWSGATFVVRVWSRVERGRGKGSVVVVVLFVNETDKQVNVAGVARKKASQSCVERA